MTSINKPFESLLTSKNLSKNTKSLSRDWSRYLLFKPTSGVVYMV